MKFTKTDVNLTRLRAEIAAIPCTKRISAVFQPDEEEDQLEINPAAGEAAFTTAEQTAITTVVTVHQAETLDEAKTARVAYLKAQYMADIRWTDDTKLWYDKLVAQGTNTSADDAEYQDAMDYWQEGWNEYAAKKQTVLDATDKATVNAVDYSPNHS